MRHIVELAEMRRALGSDDPQVTAVVPGDRIQIAGLHHAPGRDEQKRNVTEGDKI